MTRTLILPGLHNSDPGHWQSRWEARDESLRCVIQDDWGNTALRRLGRETRSSARAHRIRRRNYSAQCRMRTGCALDHRSSLAAYSRSTSRCAERSGGSELSIRVDRFRADAAAAAPVSKCCSREVQRPVCNGLARASIRERVGQ